MPFNILAPFSLTHSKNGTSVVDYEHKLLEWEKEFRELINMSGLLRPEIFNEIVIPVIDAVVFLFFIKTI